MKYKESSGENENNNGRFNNSNLKTVKEKKQENNVNSDNSSIIEESSSDASYFEDIESNKRRNLREESILTHIKILLNSSTFIIINLCLVCLFIIVSAIQFWINDYLEHCLKITDEHQRLYSISFVIITAPIVGITAGGLAASKIGGYESKKVIFIPLFSTIIAIVVGNFIPFADDVWTFGSLFWVYLFFGSLILPIANGLVLCSVSKEYSGIASSTSCFIYNMMGRLPGPNVYAVLKEICGKNSRIPLWLILNIAIIAFVLEVILLNFNYRKNYNEVIEEKDDILVNENNDKTIYKINDTDISEVELPQKKQCK